MSLPNDFQFSQGSLQDFVDCRRRFQLRYIRRLAWPAVETEPVQEHERYLELGALFHRMIQQNLLGVPAERLSGMIQDEQLRRWWDNYLEYTPELGDRKVTRYPEISLSAAVGGHRLVAKYDAVAVAEAPDTRAVILDWKTSRKRPRRNWLAGRLQTRVYLYLLVQAGDHLNRGNPFQPSQLEMVYWFAEFPDHPERFPYNQEQYETDAEYLEGLVEQIRTLGEDDFPLTGDDMRCRFCVYRSLCDRGVRAGVVGEAEEGYDVDDGDFADFSIDFEQIAEIEF